MINPYHYENGDVVEVHPVPGGYPLPDGLPDGAQVRVVNIKDAWRTVERDGRGWRVYMVNIEARAKRLSLGSVMVGKGCVVRPN